MSVPQGNIFEQFVQDVEKEKEACYTTWSKLSFENLRESKNKEHLWHLFHGGIDLAVNSKVPFRLGKAEALIRAFFEVMFLSFTWLCAFVSSLNRRPGTEASLP